MRILLTADPEIPVPPQNYGGIQRIVAQLVTYMKSQGHTVGLVAHPDSKIEQDFFLPWKTEHSQGQEALLKNIPALFHAWKSFAPDIIHSFSRLAFALLPLLQGKPLLMSYQRNPGLRQVRLASLLSRGAIYFSGCSTYITNIGKTAAPHWRTIPNFLDRNQYTPNFSSDSNAPFVFLSRLDRIKGAHTAIAIARKIERPLVIAGNISDPSYFQAAIKPFLEDPLISYVGPVSDSEKQNLLASARALLLPIEWNEPFGIVFIEALACGTPVITAPMGAGPEIVVPGKSGFLCTDFEEYCTAARAIDSIDRQQCYKEFLQSFSTEQVAPRYEDAYIDCIKRA